MTHRETIERLYEMQKLAPGWDSYSASRIDPCCIAKAVILVCELEGEWTPVPCSDGSVQLEQHADGFDIEVQISRAADRNSASQP